MIKSVLMSSWTLSQGHYLESWLAWSRRQQLVRTQTVYAVSQGDKTTRRKIPLREYRRLAALVTGSDMYQLRLELESPAWGSTLTTVPDYRLN